MEVRRRVRKNKIMNDIREAEIFITRSRDTIKRIKSSQMGETYIRNQIVKLKASVEEREESLIVLNKNLKDVYTGYLDEDIEKEYNETEKKIKAQKVVKDRIKAERLKEKLEKKDISKKYMQGIISASRSHRQAERDVNYTYKYFNKVVDSLPQYMIKNLSEMPGNKGYIWRGVYFYGYLPAQRGPCVVFEKKRGGILVIHENTESEYKRYEKEGKNRKQLVFKKLKKKACTSLMDYIVKK